MKYLVLIMEEKGSYFRLMKIILISNNMFIIDYQKCIEIKKEYHKTSIKDTHQDNKIIIEKYIDK